MSGFDLEAFVDACQGAVEHDGGLGAVQEVVERAVSDPAAIERSLGHLVDDTLGLLHRSERLTIQHGIFPPGFVTGIHEHTVAAVIGTWSGNEDNEFFVEQDGRLVSRGGRRCVAGDVLVLDPTVIHEVRALSGRWVAGLHVYLGDLRELDRREWRSPAGPASPLDGAAMVDRWLPAIEAAGLRAG